MYVFRINAGFLISDLYETYSATWNLAGIQYVTNISYLVGGFNSLKTGKVNGDQNLRQYGTSRIVQTTHQTIIYLLQYHGS